MGSHKLNVFSRRSPSPFQSVLDAPRVSTDKTGFDLWIESWHGFRRYAYQDRPRQQEVKMGVDSSTPRRALCSFQAWGLLSLVLVVTVLSFFDFEAFVDRVGQVRPARQLGAFTIDRKFPLNQICGHLLFCCVRCCTKCRGKKVKAAVCV